MLHFILNPFFLGAVIVLGFYVYIKKTTSSPKMVRGNFIQGFEFPASLAPKLLETYPHLSDEQVQKLIESLRSYFQIYNLALDEQCDELALPSKALDTAWQELASNAEVYDAFCQQAFGRLIPYKPAKEKMTKGNVDLDMENTFKYACYLYATGYKRPTRLAPIFELDKQLQIPGGFTFGLKLQDNKKKTYRLVYSGALTL